MVIFHRFRVVVANMRLVDCCLVEFHYRVVEGIDYLGWVFLEEDVVELVWHMDVV